MKNKAAQSLARLRAKSLTPERRSEIARKAAKASAVVRSAKAKVKSARRAKGEAK